MTGAPVTFDSVFREARRRRVGGGPKTTGAEEIAFPGNLGFGHLLLVSRVRLMNPQESFFTCLLTAAATDSGWRKRAL